VLRAWTDSLKERKGALRRCTTFEALERVLSEAAADIHGVGALTVYTLPPGSGRF